MITFIDSFEKIVEKKKNDVAVERNNETLSFGELKEKALYLAGLVIEKTASAGRSLVAVMLPKEINAVIADVGILYASDFFMNLDVKTPAERIANILSLSKPDLIITSHKYAGTIGENSNNILFIDDVEWTGQSDTDTIYKRQESVIDTDPMCVINTSGSTGVPKGVVLNYRSFEDFMKQSRNVFGLNGTEVMGSLSPIVFDIFDFELCSLMVYGSKLVLIDAMLSAFPARLLQYVNEKKVSFIFWVPSIMVNIANMELLDKVNLPDLRMVWFAGEVFPTKQFNYWYDKLPGVTFANLYGPIEITLDCTYYIVKERPDEKEPLPIGVPYSNTDILILNDRDELCGIDEEGELCVRGTGLAMGYYNNPEKTGKAFVQNPLNNSYPETIYRTGDIVCMRQDGNILFKGRRDSLIKHMGYRIELGEIEHVIDNDLKLVRRCCAVYKKETKEIVLYYENTEEVSDKAFRVELSKVFPSYMIPKVFIRLPQMPENTNGKIDRLLLSQKVNER